MSEYGIVSFSGLVSYTGNSWEMGYKFTVGSASIKVTGLRICFFTVQTQTAYLWSASGDKLGSVKMSSVSGMWVEGNFSTPVTLNAGETYVVSVYNNCGRYNGESSNFVFNPKISYVSGVYGSPAGSFPAGTESGKMYPLVDIIIGPTVQNHKLSGSAVYTVPGITGTAASSTIAWTEDKPTGTSVSVSVGTDGSNYTAVTNGGQFLPPGSYDNVTAYIKVELATTDATLTPTVSGLHLVMQTTEDQHAMILEMQPRQRILNAAGDVTVAYDGGGTLIGEGGAVLAFTQSFTPTGLVPKPHQNDVEHIEISSIAASGTLTKINYTDTAAQDMGHIEITSITATGTLTNVHDI